MLTLRFFPPQHKISTSIWPGVNVSPIISVSAIVLVKKLLNCDATCKEFDTCNFICLGEIQIPLVLWNEVTYGWWGLCHSICVSRLYFAVPCSCFSMASSWLKTTPKFSRSQAKKWCQSVPECTWKNHNSFVVTHNKEEDPSDYALCSLFIEGTLCRPTVHPLLVSNFKMSRSRLGVSTLFYIPFYVFIYFCFSTKRFTSLSKLNACHFVSASKFYVVVVL